MAIRRHLDLGQWADVVSGAAPEGLRLEAQAHRASCPECGTSVGLFEAAARTARSDLERVVPRDLEHIARSLFLARRPEKIGRLPRILATLVPGSAAALALAGVRSLQRASHQALYEAGQYALDLRLDEDPQNSRTILVGQIVTRSESVRKVSGAPVVLLAGREVVAQASSNQFGEFQIEFQIEHKPRQRLRLCVALGEGRIEVPLRGLSGGETVRNRARLRPFPGGRRS